MRRHGNAMTISRDTMANSEDNKRDSDVSPPDYKDGTIYTTNEADTEVLVTKKQKLAHNEADKSAGTPIRLVTADDNFEVHPPSVEPELRSTSVGANALISMQYS